QKWIYMHNTEITVAKEEGKKDNSKYILTNYLIKHYIELPKFEKTTDFANDLERWVAFFKYEGKSEEIMQKLIQANPIFAKVHECYENFRLNTELMDSYEARQKWIILN
ncbi:unnamed protein product, partial [marine sediment metagenome]